MKRLALPIAAFVSVTSLVSYFFWLNQRDADLETLVFSHARTLKFVYEVRNTSNSAIKEAGFKTYLPIQQKTRQLIDSISSNQSYATQEDQFGNRIASFDLGLIPPYGLKKVVFSVPVNTTSAVGGSELKEDHPYLISEKYIESDHAQIVALAKTLEHDSKHDTAQAIFDWVSKKIKDSGYTSQDKGALFALNNRAGDCTEHMYLTIALARANGIPARGVAGYVYASNTIVKSADYHNWAELYIDGKWNIIDTQKKVFISPAKDYVAMRVISNSAVSLLGNSHRFAVASDTLKVEMK